MWTLRRAVPDDATAVAALHVRSWQEGYRGLLPADFLAGLDPAQRAARYTFDRIGPDDPATQVAVDTAGRIGGVVTTGPRPAGEPESVGEVLACYVDPPLWRHGIGHLLLLGALTQLGRNGYDEAVLWVLDGNERAERFYRRERWTPDGGTRTARVWGIGVAENRFRTTFPRFPGDRRLDSHEASDHGSPA
ncbi:GNAT family N-acetyltransferase [Nocardia stercoris]|uniref:GNAT family N-acetyltransferase n=1 Tax=Nocardia stercoris TaxID=2483361 RepID=A0A3M2KVP5_9NOCA|nr:GNAT family N-acetyltransferase [Nocardia stercoris]RMI28283.1 GNAT family N-acetyltransferase [Nocardia stercoris]